MGKRQNEHGDDTPDGPATAALTPADALLDTYSPWISARNRLWQRVLPLGQRRSYAKGTEILGHGRAVDFLYYLNDGLVRFSNTNAQGNEKVLWYIEEGNLFGASPFFYKKPIKNTSSQLVAVEDCDVYLFSRSCVYNEIFPNHPDLVADLLESMAYKIALAINRGNDSASLLNRICKIFVYLLERDGLVATEGEAVCNIKLSQTELAVILGVHRVSLHNALVVLKRIGVIRSLTRNRLVIGKLERLIDYAREDV
jgi:CRP-like cAMP-binding protein